MVKCSDQIVERISETGTASAFDESDAVPDDWIQASVSPPTRHSKQVTPVSVDAIVVKSSIDAHSPIPYAQCLFNFASRMNLHPSTVAWFAGAYSAFMRTPHYASLVPCSAAIHKGDVGRALPAGRTAPIGPVGLA